MVFVYIGILLIACIPLIVTLRRITNYRTVAKSGLTTQGQIVKKDLVPFYKGRQVVKLQIAFQSAESHEPVTGEAITANHKHNLGDFIEIGFKKNRSKIYIIGDEKGYYPMLIFSIIMILFSLFAVYMIRDMVINGY